jgi:hypothetical protein
VLLASVAACSGSSSSPGANKPGPTTSAKPAATSPFPGVKQPAPKAGQPVAHSFVGTSTVGALFYPTYYPGLHVCTASVVRSPGHDIIMTAAHCMAPGPGKGYVFAPGYHNSKVPYGTWTTTGAYASAQWLKPGGDQHRDFVFLRVAPKLIHGKLENIQDVVGGNRLGLRPTKGESVRQTGYPIGLGGKPITCASTVYFHAGFPASNCYGFADGTSGGPWLAGRGTVRTIVGTISGLHQGGCTKATSYSTTLGRPAMAVLKLAESGQHPVSFGTMPSDGCPGLNQ